MHMSYKGKAAAAAILAIAMVYGAYFWGAPGVSADRYVVMAHMASTVILLVVVIIVLHVTMAIADKQPSHLADERDALNAARAARNGYYTLLSFIWSGPIIVLFGTPAPVTANIILAMMVLAELVHFASQVFYDLRGA
jgi:hypothetical protein